MWRESTGRAELGDIKRSRKHHDGQSPTPYDYCSGENHDAKKGRNAMNARGGWSTPPATNKQVTLASLAPLMREI